MQTPREPPGWGPSVPGLPVVVKEKVGEEAADGKEEKEGTNEEGEGDEKEVETEEPVEPAEPEPPRPLGSNPSSVRTKELFIYINHVCNGTIGNEWDRIRREFIWCF